MAIVPFDRDPARLGGISESRFKLLQEVCRCGDGAYWSAVDRRSGRNCVVRVFETGSADTSRRLGELHRERVLAERLARPEVLRTDVPLIEGKRIFQLVDPEPACTIDAAGEGGRLAIIMLLVNVARVLADAHALGVFHGAFSRASCLRTADGRLLVQGFSGDAVVAAAVRDGAAADHRAFLEFAQDLLQDSGGPPPRLRRYFRRELAPEAPRPALNALATLADELRESLEDTFPCTAAGARVVPLAPLRTETAVERVTPAPSPMPAPVRASRQTSPDVASRAATVAPAASTASAPTAVAIPQVPAAHSAPVALMSSGVAAASAAVAAFVPARAPAAAAASVPASTPASAPASASVHVTASARASVSAPASTSGPALASASAPGSAPVSVSTPASTSGPTPVSASAPASKPAPAASQALTRALASSPATTADTPPDGGNLQRPSTIAADGSGRKSSDTRPAAAEVWYPPAAASRCDAAAEADEVRPRRSLWPWLLAALLGAVLAAWYFGTRDDPATTTPAPRAPANMQPESPADAATAYENETSAADPVVPAGAASTAVAAAATRGDVPAIERPPQESVEPPPQDAAATAAQAARSRVANLIAGGNRALNTLEPEMAREAFASALALAPNDRAALEGRQRARRLAGVAALMRDAREAASRGDHVRAVQGYAQALRADPRNRGLGEALTVARRSLARDAVGSVLAEGYAALGAGRLEVARDAFARALALDPEAAGAREGAEQAATAIMLRDRPSARRVVSSEDAGPIDTSL